MSSLWEDFAVIFWAPHGLLLPSLTIGTGSKLTLVNVGQCNGHIGINYRCPTLRGQFKVCGLGRRWSIEGLQGHMEMSKACGFCGGRALSLTNSTSL